MEPRTRNTLRFRFVRRATGISTNSDLEMEREKTSVRATTMSNILTMWKHMFLNFYTWVSNANDWPDSNEMLQLFIIRSYCLDFFTFHFIKIVSNMHYITTNCIPTLIFSTKAWIPAPPTISTTWWPVTPTSL